MDMREERRDRDKAREARGRGREMQGEERTEDR